MNTIQATKWTISAGAAMVLILTATSLPAYSQALPPVPIAPGGPEYMPGEVLLQFKPNVTDAQIGEAFRQGQLNMIRHVRTPAMEDSGQIGITHVETSLPVPAVTRILNNLPGLEFAEPNWVYTHQAVANDPLYLDGSLWGMFGDDLPSAAGPDGTTNPFGSQAEKAWAAGFTGSRGVFVGVVDTSGIQSDHPDLAANVWTNPGEIPGNGIDDDGDGYIDDVHGWNAYDDNGNIYDTADKHGTHVAGTVGATGGNGAGVVGVNWDVSLISAKFGTGGMGSTLNALEAIDYMTTLRTRKGINIVALNNSWGGTGFSQALLDSITRAAQAGILFAAAAMNRTNNNDLTPYYPASYDTTASAGYDSVISVAAIDANGHLATFSDYGATSVDLGAPGVSIYSTILGSAYGTMSGTSMATPHVTGALALYTSDHPGAAPSQARNDLLTAGVRPLQALQGITVTGGMLDIGSLMTIPPTSLAAPADPANLQASVISGGRVDLTWADQSNNELGFAIERSADGGVTFILVDTVGANFTSYSDRTARPATTYSYRLRASSPGGSSAYIYAPAPVTTPFVALPAAPTSLTASAQPSAKGGGIILAWTDKSSNEDVFQIERKTGSAGTWQFLASVSANSVKYTDLTTVTRTLYYYRVRAYNAAGSSAYSNEVSATSK